MLPHKLLHFWPIAFREEEFFFYNFPLNEDDSTQVRDFLCKWFLKRKILNYFISICLYFFDKKCDPRNNQTGKKWYFQFCGVFFRASSAYSFVKI